MFKIKKRKTGIGQILKRAACAFLIAVILSMTVASNYYEARYCKAAATGTLTLAEVIATVLLSLGVTCEFSSDLSRIAARVQHDISSWTSEAEREIMEEWAQRKSVKVSDPAEASLWSKLKEKVRSLISDVDKSKAVTDSNIGNSATTQTVSIRNGLLSNDQLMELFSGVPIYLNGDSSRPLESFTSKENHIYYYLFDHFQFIQKEVGSDGSLTITLYIPDSPTVESGVFGKYLQMSGDSVSFRFADNGYVCSNCIRKYVFTKATAATKSFQTFTFSNDETSSNYNVVSYTDCTSIPLEDIDVIYSKYGVYDSFQDFVDSNMVYSTYPLTGSIYGDQDITFDDTKDFSFAPDISQQVEDAIQDYIDQHPDATDEDKNDVVAGIIAGMTDVSDKVDDTNESVTAGNTWLEKIFNKVNSSMDVPMSSVKNAVVAVGATSGDILDETKKTSSKLSTVSSWLPGLIMEGIFQVWNSAEQRAFREDLFIKLNQIISILNSIAGKDFSPVVNVSPPLVNVPEPKVNVTVPAPEVNVTVPAPQVVVDNKTDLSGISSLLSSILSALIGIKTKVDTIPGKMDTLIDAVKVPDNIVVPAPQVTVDNKTDLSGIEKSLSSIFSVLTAIQKKLDVVPEKIDILVDAVNALPEKISEPVIHVTTEVPDVIVPEIEIPEITISETQVTNTVKQVFLIDTDRVHMDADRLLKGYSSHFPDLTVLLAIILLFSFPSEVEYPVFEISTPEILKDYVGSDSIILLDCEDYSIYFSWTRNLIRAFIWIYFVYSIFGHFKVRFTVS